MALEDGRQTPSLNPNPNPNSNPSLGCEHYNPTPTRPTSSYTLNSAFADSAVDMDTTSPKHLPDPLPGDEPNYLHPPLPSTPQDVDQTISDKLRQLAAVAWTLEQDDNMTARKRRRIHTILEDLEAHLEASSEQAAEDDLVENAPCQDLPADEVASVGVSQPAQDLSEESDEWIDESELIAVRNDLAATLTSMRLRQEEQRHLHQLTATKLEAVAQRCILEEHRAEHLSRELQELRLENQTLGSDNDHLRGQLSILELEASRNEVAVEAMSSAVTGLEGWIQSTEPSGLVSPTLATKSKRQRVVIRGKGRFRGRYYVDEDGDHAVAYSLADAAADGQELHDGVKAWLRGFRDVEEELRLHEPAHSSHPGRFQTPGRQQHDDWGDFQSPE